MKRKGSVTTIEDGSGYHIEVRSDMSGSVSWHKLNEQECIRLATSLLNMAHQMRMARKTGRK
jgi:hypothetical protein